MPKKFTGEFVRAICILQIFRNNPIGGVWLYYQILMIAKINKTDITAKILKHKKMKVFLWSSSSSSRE